VARGSACLAHSPMPSGTASFPTCLDVQNKKVFSTRVKCACEFQQALGVLPEVSRHPARLYGRVYEMRGCSAQRVRVQRECCSTVRERRCSSRPFPSHHSSYGYSQRQPKFSDMMLFSRHAKRH